MSEQAPYTTREEFMNQMHQDSGAEDGHESYSSAEEVPSKRKDDRQRRRGGSLKRRNCVRPVH